MEILLKAILTILLVKIIVDVIIFLSIVKNTRDTNKIKKLLNLYIEHKIDLEIEEEKQKEDS